MVSTRQMSITTVGPEAGETQFLFSTQFICNLTVFKVMDEIEAWRKDYFVISNQLTSSVDK